MSIIKSGVNAPAFNVDKHAASLFAAAVAMSVVYVMAVSTIGFIIATPLLLIGLMVLFGERSIVKMLIIAVITTVCIWLLFTEVFMIFLPAGRLFEGRWKFECLGICLRALPMCLSPGTSC